MELQQFKFNVRQLGIFIFDLCFADDFSSKIFNFVGYAFHIRGIFYALDTFQREIKKILQSGNGDRNFCDNADRNLLFFECL